MDRLLVVVFSSLLVIGCTDTGTLPANGDMAACDANGASCGTGGGCASDSDCSGATPRCDKNTGKCAPCLPVNDNCPKGSRCVPKDDSFACTMSCTSDADCPKTDAGASATCCLGACIDTTNDTKNCGGCGKLCPDYPNGVAACVSGLCTLGSCNAGFANCNNSVVDGCETTTATDIKNCGACGNACTAGANTTAMCSGGMCSSTCAASFADCNKDPKDGCEANTQTDIQNCGGCGTVCGMLPNATTVCMAGVCAVSSCTVGFADCDKQPQNGCEASIQTDAANCGACGKACGALPNATAGCKNGACGVGMCTMGYTDCDGVAANGCEVQTATDANNCGACAHKCAGSNSMQSCMAGACTITACSPGFADCDGKPDTGCETNISGDANNCGGCGKMCPVPANATATCMNAQCGIGGCKFGFADCNMNPMDGCEADLLSTMNCGKCGNVCMAPANATAGCNGGMCGIGMCSPLWGNCDGNAANGCELSLAADLNNCGACNAKCAPANATAACLNGQCGYSSCNAGYADCDGNVANGCEVNLNTDAKNCGKCGNACPMNMPTCSNGVCGTYGDWLVGAQCLSTTCGACDPNANGYHYKGAYNGYQCWFFAFNQNWSTTNATNIYHLAQHFGLNPATGRVSWCDSFNNTPQPLNYQVYANYDDINNVGAFGCCNGYPTSGGWVCLQ